MFVSELKLHECKNGHETSEVNTYRNPDGSTACRVCRREAAKKYYFKNREKCRAMNDSWKSKNPANVAKYNERKRLKCYDLSQDKHDEMFLAQGGKCAICKKSQQEKLAIDHDKISGKVRGLLCDKCNMGIGLLDHCLENLESAFKYLS